MIIQSFPVGGFIRMIHTSQGFPNRKRVPRCRQTNRIPQMKRNHHKQIQGVPQELFHPHNQLSPSTTLR